jgi:hypothetical protein
MKKLYNIIKDYATGANATAEGDDQITKVISKVINYGVTLADIVGLVGIGMGHAKEGLSCIASVEAVRNIANRVSALQNGGKSDNLKKT